MNSLELNFEATPQRKVYRVSELTRLIRMTLEDEFGTVWVEGELSNVHAHTSGHVYFTLKDETAQIQAALFRRERQQVRFELKDGLKVRVLGDVTAYEARSQYQIIVRHMEPLGRGDLQEAFERLKKKLQAEGLFDAARKKRLPLLPRRIGIVTSPTGAAIRDMLNILSRRFPNVYVLIAPVKVQGEGAAEEIAAAIDLLNARGGLDVLIVGRGGGSLEDLWAFNEEIVARAIARSKIPIISAVGHEIDFTISDFVADLRAPTPSAAAELVVRPKAEFEAELRHWAQRLSRALRQRVLELRNRLLRAERSDVFRAPRHVVRNQRQRVESLAAALRREIRHELERRQQRLDELAARLPRLAQRSLEAQRQRLKRGEVALTALNPRRVLERGYSITRRKRDQLVVRSADEVMPGESVLTLLARGWVESNVIQRGNHAGEVESNADEV